MKIIKSISEASEYCSQLKNKGKTIATINTGGNLHEGHMHLVSMARDNADIVIVMIDFPVEYFNMDEDKFNIFSKNYKSNVLQKDIKLCLTNKVDIFFTPSMWDMYGEKITKLKVFNNFIEDSIKREKSILWDFEHIMSFIKDYNILKTDVTVLGQKDIHQTMSMIGIINALNFSVKPLIAPIIRENDGIPFSSRNKELSKGQRKRASYICERIQKISEWESYTSAEEIKKYLTDVVKNSRAKLYSLNVYDFKTGKNMDIIDREVIIVIGILFNEIYIEDNIRILPK